MHHAMKGQALCHLALAAALGAGFATAARAADLKRAEEIVQGRCFICHGTEGESSSPVFPRLAGQHAAYVARQLADYKSGRRQSNTMRPMVEDLGPDDFAALGAWYASRAPQAHPVDDTELAQVGAGTAELPRLAGQHAQYAVNQLKAFGRRERTNDNAVMHDVASKLTEQAMKAVAAYLSGLK